MNLERGGATNLLEDLQSGMQAGEPGWQLRDPGVRRHADLGLPMPRPQLSSNLLYSPGATGRPYKDPYDYTPFNELGPPPSTGRTAPWETVGPQQPIMPMDATPGDWGPLKPIQTQPSTLLEAAQLNPEAVMPAETGGFWQGSGASMAGAGIGAGIGLIGGLIQGAAKRLHRVGREVVLVTRYSSRLAHHQMQQAWHGCIHGRDRRKHAQRQPGRFISGWYRGLG